MDRERLIDIMKKPYAITDNDIEELCQLTKTYPYFTVSHILLAIGMYKTKHVESELQLRKAAVMTPDRNMLRRIFSNLQDNCYEEETCQKADTDTIPTEDEPIHDVVFVTDETIDNHEEPESIDENKISLDETSMINIPADELINIPELYLGDSIEKLNEEIELLERKKQTLDELKSRVEKKLMEMQNKENDVNEDEISMTKDEIIDKFIANNPSITRPKSEFFNPISAAQNSVTDHENVISETLANIYLKQGYVDKAISIYQKLSLKYPKKSIYFANLIEEAKKKFNN